MMSHGAVAPAKSLPRGMLWTGIVLMILGFIVGIVAIVVGVVKVVNAASDSAKFTGPGSIDLVLQPGDHAIWAGGAGIRAHAAVTVTGPSGVDVPVLSYDGSGTLTLDSEAYVPEVVFTTTQAGSYTIKVELDEPAAATPFPLLVGPTPESIATSAIIVVSIIGLGAVLFIIGVVLLIVALVRRSGARKRAALAAAGGGYPAQPVYPAQPTYPVQPTYPGQPMPPPSMPPPPMPPPPMPPPPAAPYPPAD